MSAQPIPPPAPEATSVSCPPGGTSDRGQRLLHFLLHELRTPLNVMSLSLELIAPALPQGATELAGDVKVVEENLALVARMLATIGDYQTVASLDALPAPSSHDPRALARTIATSREYRDRTRVVLDESCPTVATIDLVHLRMALAHALDNAVAAAEGNVTRVELAGTMDHWTIALSVSVPAPGSVATTRLRGDAFERVLGTARHRLGMDLAIVARVVELHGGSAWLDVLEDRATVIRLELPIGGA